MRIHPLRALEERGALGFVVYGIVHSAQLWHWSVSIVHPAMRGQRFSFAASRPDTAAGLEQSYIKYQLGSFPRRRSTVGVSLHGVAACRNTLLAVISAVGKLSPFRVRERQA